VFREALMGLSFLPWIIGGIVEHQGGRRLRQNYSSSSSSIPKTLPVVGLT
jgi:hypothetical protein